MLVYGIDFTSSPKPRRPLVVAQCSLDGDTLHLTDLLRLRSFDQLERSLRASGEWIAGFDFPFGQPRKLLRNLGWPEGWEGYVSRVAELSRPEYEDLLEMYKAARPSGDKEHRRRTDVVAQSVSPMKLYGVPVAKMFFEGAPRLLRSGVSILPCHPTDDPRVAVEAYPALVARALIGKRSYKKTRSRGGAKRRQDRVDARRKLVAAILGEPVRERYGVGFDCGHFLSDEMIADEGGDLLDAAFAAVQAAWCWQRRDRGWGIPGDADPVEGWIVDPVTLERHRKGWR